MPKQSSFTSTNSKMGSIPKYEKGGLVKKPKESNMYHAGMDQPKNPDMMTSLTPEQRKAAEARMKAEERKKK